MKVLIQFLSFIMGSLPATAIMLPEVHGPHAVGTISLKLVDESRDDPFAPTPQKRAVLVSFFYPTAETCYPRANYTPPAEATFFEQQYGLPPIINLIVPRAYAGAPMQHAPVVLFSPGYGSMKEFYTEMAEDLASRGYLVVAVAHPYDSDFVEFPDGTVVIGNLTVDQVPLAQDVRVADCKFVLDAIASKKFGINTRRVGMFGHSLGGSTAANLMLNDSRVIAGINMDGEFFGEPADIKRPFMVLARKDHSIWAGFWKVQTGWKREFDIAGAAHGSFADYGTIVEMLGLEGFDELVGNITGLRMNKIVTTYVGSFFDFAFKGHEFDVPEFSEVANITLS